MSILDRSIRHSVDSCNEALEDGDQDELHRVCSRDTLDDSDEIIDVNPVFYSNDNLLGSSSSMQLRSFKSSVTMAEDTDDQQGEEEEDGLPDYGRGSREKMMSYEVNYVTDSEDDDDVYEPQPDWQVYAAFQEGVLEENGHTDALPIHESRWMMSTDKMALDAAAEWDLSQRMGRKRHYRLGQMSSDLEDLVKQLDVIPAKIRRLEKREEEEK